MSAVECVGAGRLSEEQILLIAKALLSLGGWSYCGRLGVALELARCAEIKDCHPVSAATF